MWQGCPRLAVSSAPWPAAPSHCTFLALEASPGGVQWAEPLHWPFGLAAPLHPEAPLGSGAGRAWVALSAFPVCTSHIQVSRWQGWVGFLGRGGLGVPAAPHASPHGSF